MPFIFCSCSTALNGLSSWSVVVGWLLGTLPTVAETSLVSCPKHRWESSPELVGRAALVRKLNPALFHHLDISTVQRATLWQCVYLVPIARWQCMLVGFSSSMPNQGATYPYAPFFQDSFPLFLSQMKKNRRSVYSVSLFSNWDYSWDFSEFYCLWLIQSGF